MEKTYEYEIKMKVPGQDEPEVRVYVFKEITGEIAAAWENQVLEVNPGKGTSYKDGLGSAMNVKLELYMLKDHEGNAPTAQYIRSLPARWRSALIKIVQDLEEGESAFQTLPR